MRTERHHVPGSHPGSPTGRPGLRAAVVLGATLALGLAFAGCSSTPRPTPVSGRLEATARLNPSVSDRPSPVLVRVYELRARPAFDGADFMSLFQSDTATLGADLVAKDEFTLSPGESRPWSRTLSPDTRWLAVFVAFRDLEHAQWRAVAAIENGKRQQATVRLDARAVTLDVTR